MPPTASDDVPLDRLQRAVAGWVGPAVYALPILEVWLLMRLGESGATVLLVALQAVWVACLVLVFVICARRWRTPGPSRGPLTAVTDTFGVGRQCVSASGLRELRGATAAASAVPEHGEGHRRGLPASTPRRLATRSKPRRRGDH